MKTRNLRSLLIVAGLALSAWMIPAGVAATPTDTSFTYQGELQDGAGVANGQYDLTFKLFDANAAGAQVGPTITLLNQSVTNGRFTSSLNFGANWNSDARWLEIAVRPAGVGGYTTLSPRQALSATPYAQGLVLPAAETASTTGGLLTFTNSNIANTAYVMKLTSGGPSGNTPGYAYQPVLIADTNDGNGIVSMVNSLGGYAYYARIEGSNGVGMVIQNAASGGQGVTVSLSSATNPSTGIGATTNGTGRAGAFIINNSANSTDSLYASTDGTGRAGYFNSANAAATTEALRVVSAGTAGIYATAAASGATAIEGYSSAGNSYGVLGTGTSAGVRGECGSSNGAGVYGYTTAAGGNTGTGVRGDAPNGAAGVSGYSNLGTGVYGQTSSGYGIYGSNGGSNSSGYAGYFNGRVHVNGTLSKNSGSFKIDHPTDPENKYLYHSFVESPDMKNIYDGVVTLDASGQATVTMPEWFSALNSDFRYQLTCVGGFAPVYISQEISSNHFAIAGGKPGMKVSWQVTGTRIDPWAQYHRIQVEEDKGADRGKYLNPEVYGQPETKRIGVKGINLEPMTPPVATTPAHDKN